MKADPQAIEICRKRAQDHIDRVQFFYKKLVELGAIPEEDIDLARVAKHDADKLIPKNLERQALRFTNSGTISPEAEKEINDVIREHVKTNPHHSEYWGGPGVDHLSKGVDCTKEPDTYLYEMVADWMATAEERGTKCIDWFNKCIPERWIYNEHQCDLIKRCIGLLNKYQGPKRDYGFTYVDPAQMKKMTQKSDIKETVNKLTAAVNKLTEKLTKCK